MGIIFFQFVTFMCEMKGNDDVAVYNDSVAFNVVLHK